MKRPIAKEVLAITLQAFEQLLAQYETDVYTFCCYLTHGNADIAGDLYQETVLYAFQTRERIDLGSNPKALLFAIAAGKFKNHRKKLTRRQAIAPQVALDDAGPILTDIAELPEARLLRKQKNATIAQGLHSLKDKYRLPLTLFYYDDLSTEDIATALDIPIGTVKSRLHKGRSLMKAYLAKEGYHEH